MIYIVLVPLWLLLMPANTEGIILSFVIFPEVGWLIGGWREKSLSTLSICNGKTALKLRTVAGTVFIAAILSYAFYNRWVIIPKVAMIAEVLRISVQAFVGLVALLLACAAVWSMSWMIHNIVHMHRHETYSPVLSINHDQTNCMTDKLDRDDRLLCVILALGGAIAFCNVCPFIGKHPDSDSCVFLYIGREMLRGKIPYVDLFDHKGIVLYLIQCMGLLLSLPGTYSGVWLIELASLLATAIYMYKTIRMLTASKVIGQLTLLIVFTSIGMYYNGGNFTEGYALPWIAIAVYVYLKFFMTLRYRSIEVVTLGVGCAVVAFLRVNMIGIWVAFTPLVIYFLLKERKYKEIFHCIGCFVGGLAFVCIPLGIYFVLTDSLDSMIKYYVQFNLSYTESNASVIDQLHAIFALGSGIHITAVIFAVMTYKYVRIKRVFQVNMWGFAVSLFFSTISGRAYDHYGLILFPLLVIPFLCTIWIAVDYLEQTNEERNAHIGWMFGNLRRIAAVIACLVLCSVIMNKVMRVVLYDYKLNPEAVKYLSEMTNESDDVLMIGVANEVLYYLESNRKTDNKFFYQFPPIGISDVLYDEFLDELIRNPSDCILFYSKGYISGSLKERLEQWCQEGVYIYEDLGSFIVYRHQDF